MENNRSQQALLQLALGNHRATLALLDQEPETTSNELARASILLNLAQYQASAEILERQRGQAKGGQTTFLHFLLGKAYFFNGQLEQAVIESQRAKDSLAEVTSELEREDLQRQVDVLIRKIELELTNSTRVGNINDAAYIDKAAVPLQQTQPVAQPHVQKVIPAIDPKYDWYQNSTHVFLSFKVASPEVAKQTQIQFEHHHVHLQYNDTVIYLELSSEIVPSESSFTAASKKIEVKLRKSIEGAGWLKVEKDGEAKLIATGTVH